VVSREPDFEDKMTCIPDDETLRSILERRARHAPDHVFCIWKDEKITIGALDEAVNRLANGLAGIGIRPGDHVATMMANSPRHIHVMLALAKLGAVWIPINIHLKGPSLEFTLQHSHPRATIADSQHQELLRPHLGPVELRIWLDGAPAGEIAYETLEAHPSAANPPFRPAGSDVLCISYTSGTTGQPKGVLLTDKMMRACGYGCALCGNLEAGDTILVWEPIYHAGGNQMVALALVHDVTIVLTEKFSASNFWPTVHRHGVNAFHYLGGILQILLKQPRRPDDADNPMVKAWGGGCTLETWREFEERFGVAIYEDYGMTETSSYATYNPERRLGSIGRELPYFTVRIGDDEGRPVAAGTIGEIMVREKEPGLLLPSYYDNPEATASALRDGWLHTGDLGRADADGYFYFLGRKKDSVRRRGENISAWEVERVINDHPEIVESALIAVKSDVGDEDLKIVIKPVAGRKPDPRQIAEWCVDRMPYFQIPRYFAFVEDFLKTPTERIKKELLSRATDDCWDREARR
jgi:crotonobetaine/carnitine-CoA ligase